MKKLLIVFVLLSLCAVFVFADKGDALIGKWYTENNDSIVEIYKSNGRYYGKIISLKEPNDENGKPKVDSKNPNAKLRSRKIVGLQILNNFKAVRDDRWEGGTIYNPADGQTYSCEMVMKNNGKVLRVRGFVGISLFGKTQVWNRVP